MAATLQAAKIRDPAAGIILVLQSGHVTKSGGQSTRKQLQPHLKILQLVS